MVTYRIEFEIPGLPNLNSASNLHWRTKKRNKDRWQTWVRSSVNAQGVPKRLLDQASVACTRYSSSEPDSDNLAESFKPLIDALVGLVVTDDSPEVLGSADGRYRWEYAPPKKGFVRMVIKERGDVRVMERDEFKEELRGFDAWRRRMNQLEGRRPRSLREYFEHVNREGE